jgi:hypothetical protein
MSLAAAGQEEHADLASVLSPQALTANPNPSSNPRMIFVCPIALLRLGLVKASEPNTRGDADGSQAFSDDSTRQSTRSKSPGLYARSKNSYAGPYQRMMENQPLPGVVSSQFFAPSGCSRPK